jgi:hypothetical protein
MVGRKQREGKEGDREKDTLNEIFTVTSFL